MLSRSLNRPYARVDRPKLKRRLLDRCLSQGVKFHRARVDSVSHGGGQSTLKCGEVGSQTPLLLGLGGQTPLLLGLGGLVPEPAF